MPDRSCYRFTTEDTEAASRHTESTELQDLTHPNAFCVFCDGRRPFCVFRGRDRGNTPSSTAQKCDPPMYTSTLSSTITYRISGYLSSSRSSEKGMSFSNFPSTSRLDVAFPD